MLPANIPGRSRLGFRAVNRTYSKFRWMLAALLVTPGCSLIERETSLPAPAAFSAVESGIQKDIDSGALPSAAFAVVRGGRIVYEKALGWADKEARVASTPRTPYALASATKPIIATAAMVLVERGQLALDRRAADLAGCCASLTSAEFSVRQLLQHTSGLGTYAHIDWADQPEPDQSLGERFGRYGFAAQRPGVMFEYSNIGYGLLGHILERQSGLTLDALLADRLFNPLGMRDTGLANGFSPPVGAARKYSMDGQPLADTRNDTPAAGNLYASVRDLASFAAFSLGHGPTGVLSAQSRQRMQSESDPHAQYSYYGGAHYGLGWYFAERGGESLVWHEGGMPGASSLILLLPKRDLAVVVLINANDLNLKAQELGRQILAAISPDLAIEPLVATDGLVPLNEAAGFDGRWQGIIEVDGKSLRWALQFESGKPVRAEFLDAGSTLPRKAEFRALVNGDFLLGTLVARLPGQDVHPGDGYLLLRLRREGDTLAGMVVAYAAPQRLEHLLPFRATLTRVTAQKRH